MIKLYCFINVVNISIAEINQLKNNDKTLIYNDRNNDPIIESVIENNGFYNQNNNKTLFYNNHNNDCNSNNNSNCNSNGNINRDNNLYIYGGNSNNSNSNSNSMYIYGDKISLDDFFMILARDEKESADNKLTETPRGLMQYMNAKYDYDLRGSRNQALENQQIQKKYISLEQIQKRYSLPDDKN